MTPTPPPFLWDAFKDGARFTANAVETTMACREIGSILLPTGHIVACDPFTEIHTRAFQRTVEPDAYAVFLAIANYGIDQRVAAAMILFAVDVRPVHWEFAIEADSDPEPNFGYIVDSAKGCFMDLKLARRLYRQAESGRLDRYQRRIESQLVENDRWPTWSWANVRVTTEPETNIVGFTTGIGDGTYPSFFGLDNAGHAICLITDFGLLDDRADHPADFVCQWC